MTKAKSKYPIESFGPELMAALLRGGQEQIAIPFENTPAIDGSGKRRAHTFQRRIHMLRQRMREEDHPDYRLAARAKVSIFWGPRAAEIDPVRFDKFKLDVNGNRGAVIVIRPQDSEFTDILKDAGLTSIPERTAIEQVINPAEPVAGSYDAILDLGDSPIPSPEKPEE